MNVRQDKDEQIEAILASPEAFKQGITSAAHLAYELAIHPAYKEQLIKMVLHNVSAPSTPFLFNQAVLA